MKFAKYWAKCDITINSDIFGRKKISIWGASNENENEARLHANQRLVSMATCLGGDFSKYAEYEYGIGFIKEEILAEVKSLEGDELAIISRNGYGATILNTACVVFGDIDIRPLSFFERVMHRFGKTKKDKNYFLKQIEQYQRNNVSLSFRVYETHSGIRFILTSKQLSPDDSFVESMFHELNVDPLYIRLCKQQGCFRARLTPKPWRIYMTKPSSRYPRSNENEIHEYKQWLVKYESASADYTTTKYLASFGMGKISADIQKIIDIHDSYNSRTSEDLA